MSLNPPVAVGPGCRAWVIGASTGIGRATTLELARRGASVVASARSQAALAALASGHPGILALPMDVTQRGDVVAAWQMLEADALPVNLVFVCAGHFQAVSATAFDYQECLRHIQVNQVGALNVLDAVLPSFLARQGDAPRHISLMGSVAGYRGLPKALAYGPTKAAVIHLAETLYLELSGRGIGVSLVNPGFVETPLTAGNRFHMPGLISAQEAALHIVRGWERGDFEMHFPKRFTLWLKALRPAWAPLYFAAVKRFTQTP